MVEKDSLSDHDVITVFHSISLLLFIVTRHILVTTSVCAMGQKPFLTSHYSGSLQSFEGDWLPFNFFADFVFFVMNY